MLRFYSSQHNKLVCEINIWGLVVWFEKFSNILLSSEQRFHYLFRATIQNRMRLAEWSFDNNESNSNSRRLYSSQLRITTQDQRHITTETKGAYKHANLNGQT